MRGYLGARGIAGSSQRSGASARRRLFDDRYVAQRCKREDVSRRASEDYARPRASSAPNPSADETKHSSPVVHSIDHQAHCGALNIDPSSGFTRPRMTESLAEEGNVLEYNCIEGTLKYCECVEMQGLEVFGKNTGIVISNDQGIIR